MWLNLNYWVVSFILLCVTTEKYIVYEIILILFQIYNMYITMVLSVGRIFPLFRTPPNFACIVFSNSNLVELNICRISKCPPFLSFLMKMLTIFSLSLSLKFIRFVVKYILFWFIDNMRCLIIIFETPNNQINKNG